MSINLFAKLDTLSYTRSQAITDGHLVDLNQFIPVKLSGYKNPVACTAKVYDLIDKAVKNEKHRISYETVVWDILHMSRYFTHLKWDYGRLFKVIIPTDGREEWYELMIIGGPGDNEEPVLTIAFPDED